MKAYLEVPGCVEQVLSEFADVMPPKLPKNLPPWRATDHKIEVVVWFNAPCTTTLLYGSKRVG